MSKTTEDILTDKGELDEQKVAALVDSTSKAESQQGKPLAEVFAEEEAKQETTRRDEKVRDDDAVDPSVKDATGDDDWVSADDIRELVESLGYSDDDVSEFQSRDEFERHVKLVDRQFMRDGREVTKPRPGDDQEAALQAQEVAISRQEASERAKQQPRENGRFVSAEATEDGYKPQLDDEFDERIIEEFQRLSGYYEGRIKALESRYQEDTQRSEANHFNAIVDALGQDDLFGKSEEIRPRSEQAKNRDKLLEASRILMAGIASRRGGDQKLTESLVKRAANLEFADHFSKKQRQSFNDRIRRQAARRHGSGSQRVSAQAYAGDPTKHPDLLAAFRAMEAENG